MYVCGCIIAGCTYFGKQVLNGHRSSNLSDFCDGKVYSEHPLFSVHSSALQVFFYFDDLEICNPLGSKAKVHKLSEYFVGYVCLLCSRVQNKDFVVINVCILSNLSGHLQFRCKKQICHFNW